MARSALLMLFAAGLASAQSSQPEIGELVDQLESRSCAFVLRGADRCELRPLPERLSAALLCWL